MNGNDITRIPSRNLPSKSAVATYRLPGGGGFLWAVAASPDRAQDIRTQTRIVKAEIVVTDHDNKPAFDEAWASWMPAGYGPVRSFVQSVMPAGDLIEIIITAALPAGARDTSQASG
jgi:hypothetical protein